MSYKLLTRTGHNLFTMLSLLQKAIRRGDYQGAGYAAYECFEKYHKVLWKRILTVSAEDCWGIVTKEIMALKYLDEQTGEKNRKYVSQAIKILCDNKKSRDACYYACNFILGTITKSTIEYIPQDFIQKTINDCDILENDVFSIINIGSKNKKFEKDDFNKKELFPIVYIENEKEWLCALLRKAVRTLDMENAGYALNSLMQSNFYNNIWNVLLVISLKECSGFPSKEIIALKLADDYVNKNKKFGQRDEIYISKAVMILMYYIENTHETVCGGNAVNYATIIERTDNFIDINTCELENNQVPDWVYDVHTLKGKRAGKTDWEMNLVEFAGLKPLQKGFFDEGDWSLRYEYKHKNNLCSEKEYQDMLKYKVGRKCNPVEKIKDKFEKNID